jgi:putative MATE family efflux protein
MIMTREKGFYKRIIMLMLPLALQSVVAFAVSLADNLMVGSLGEGALSGVYVANQLQSILHMLVTGLSAALIVLASQYWGQRDSRRVKIIIGIALRLALGSGFVFLVATLAFPAQIMGFFCDNNPTIVAGSLDYLRIIRFTYIFFCVNQVLMASMRCVENVKIGLYASLMTFFTNVFLNWVLIFGNLGAPALGVRGAAIATLTARILETVLMIVYVTVVDRRLRFRPVDFLLFETDLLKRFFKYGLPVILGDLFWGINLAAQGWIIGHLGTTAVASVSVANTVFQVFSVAVFGMAGASAIVIGQTVGQGNNQKVREYARTLQVLFLIVGLASGLVLFLVRDLLPYVYTNLEAETLDMTRLMLGVLSVTVIGTAYQMASLTGIVRAGGATHFVLVNDLIFVWLIVIPSALIAAFYFHASPVVVFACLKCDQVLKCLVAVVKVNRFRWIKNLTTTQTKELPA